MNTFLNADFLLQTETAKELYHNHASKMPVIDFHCHINPRQVAENYGFADLTEIWLGGDHYKWRAMRANGVNEDYITGNKPSYEKFMKWAETMPYTLRNPLYHWTHLELSRVFGVDKVLNPVTAREIYDECTGKLQTPEYRALGIMKKMNVEVICTTDDPADSLQYHKQHKENLTASKMLPTWRPDKAMAIDNPADYNAYLAKLEEAANISINSYDALMQALQIRHDYFESLGCCVSDHGMETFYAEAYSDAEIRAIFDKVRAGKEACETEILKFRSAMLHDFAVMDAKSGWVQQFHVGANRNNNLRMFAKLGADTGFDAIHDSAVAGAMNRFFGRLDLEGALTKTIVYNLNPRDNELMVTNAYNFNDGSVPGKMQYGAAWWFLDQKTGMENQLNALSALGLLSRFVGMLTDSRSFLSYPRHEYFRRILCNVLGSEIESGEIPVSELPFVGKMVEDISYNNARSYFNFKL